MKPNRFRSYEWDAIAGILAATAAIVLHQLHIADEHPAGRGDGGSGKFLG